MTTEAKTEIKNKIIIGLEKAYDKMLEFKKQKKTEVVVIQNNKIVRIKP